MRASLRDRRQRETELVGCWKQQGAGGGDGSWGKRADTGAPEQHGGRPHLYSGTKQATARTLDRQSTERRKSQCV